MNKELQYHCCGLFLLFSTKQNKNSNKDTCNESISSIENNSTITEENFSNNNSHISDIDLYEHKKIKWISIEVAENEKNDYENITKTIDNNGKTIFIATVPFSDSSSNS